MLEILYRIYRTRSQEEIEKMLKDDLKGSDHAEGNSWSLFHSYSNQYNEEVLMDCFLCETKEDFKKSIKETWGEDIKFKASKKYPPNTYYCVVIGEHCYNSERYFNKIEYECDYCHNKVVGFIDKRIKIEDYELKNNLCNQFDKYGDKSFCSHKCKNRYIDQEKAKLISDNDGLNTNLWIDKDSFANDSDVIGYIYKITKKSTDEFYVGQTIYNPIFRWGQHLKTDRFPFNNIIDYKFEVLDYCYKNENIITKEKHYIQEEYKKNPEKSLNISQTKNINMKVDLFENYNYEETQNILKRNINIDEKDLEKIQELKDEV